MAKTMGDVAAFCKAIGIVDPENVRRVIIDVAAMEHPKIYIERYVDDQMIIDAMLHLVTGARIPEVAKGD